MRMKCLHGGHRRTGEQENRTAVSFRVKAAELESRGSFMLPSSKES